MKKLIPFLSAAVLLVACNSKPENTEVKTLQSAQQNAAMDTTGLAQFQQWKTQNELAVATEVQQPQLQTAPVKTVEVIREVRIVEKPVRVRETAPVRDVEPTVPAPVEDNNETTASGDVATSNSGSGQGTETAPAPAEETAKKEGWSKSAKGAAIGGGAGAVIGAVISKNNRAAGAVIGGVLGGAVGYGIGKAKDKKDGRN